MQLRTYQLYPHFMLFNISVVVIYFKTSRARHKSAPYLRLKTSKSTSKCEFCYSARKTHQLDRIGKEQRFEFFEISVAKHKNKLEGDSLNPIKSFRKQSHNAKKLKWGPFGIFQHPLCRKTTKNLILPKKKLKGGPFGLTRYCMLR